MTVLLVVVVSAVTIGCLYWVLGSEV